MSGKIQNPSPAIWAIGLGIFVVSFIVLFWLGDYRFIAGFFLALLIALLATIVVYLCFNPGSFSLGKDEEAASTESAPDAAMSSDLETGATAEVAPAQVAAPSPAEVASDEPVAEEPVSDSETAPAQEAAAEPDAASVAGTRPDGLDAPRDGVADDLKKIKGVGPKMEKLCNSLGFWHFDQIAAWSASEVAWVDENLTGFKGRVTRDEWVEQARVLAENGETEFSKRVDKGDVY